MQNHRWVPSLKGDYGTKQNRSHYARDARAEVVVVKSWLAPQLLPAIQLLLDMLVEVVRVEEDVVEL